jgi:DNA helicase-4
VDDRGRYGFQRDLLPRAPKHLTVRFRTAHGSKGLEADHVVVVGLETGTYGFPSTIADDPVLDLAMPAAEGYPHAEERRLLYVALTRARRSVTLVAPPTRVSPFVVELLDHPDVVTRTAGGTERERVTVCPACGAGTMTPRTGPYSTFLGCTRFPACRHTQRLPAEVART